MLRMSKRAVMAMEDSYNDRLIDAYSAAKRNVYSDFPMHLAKEAKAIHEELCWMEEGGWITSEEAGNLWKSIETSCQEFLADWESEIDND